MTIALKFSTWALLGCIASASFAQDARDDELLEAGRAFALSAEALDASRVAVTWAIADDYYMYRDKYQFTVVEGARLKEVRYPRGKIKRDDFFGEVEVYEGEAEFVMHLADAARELRLELAGQGCNEPVGVCYPPIVERLALAMPVASAFAQDGFAARSGLDAVEELRGLLGDVGGGDEFLPVDDAFRLEVSAVDGNALDASFRVAHGYYLYRDKIGFSVARGAARVGEVSMPPGIDKEDEYFGRVEVYPRDFRADVALLRARPEPVTVTVDATYQGCADEGICYPPVSKSFTLDLPALVRPAAAAEGAPPAAGSADRGGSYVGYLSSAFLVGLALTFTPCVLPMVPILSGMIVGQGARATRARAGLLSLVYVLGAAVTYAAAGWVAGAVGEQLQAYFQNVWAIGALSLVLVSMALSMFGLYEIRMPSFVQSRVQKTGASMPGGALVMAFVLGLGSALIVGACVSPLLISVLSVAIGKGDPLLGASMMVSMALGMGVFLIAAGFGAGFLLPKTGAWMRRVNHVFGVLLIGVAIYLLSALPAVPVLLLWAAFLIVLGVYMGATQALPHGAPGWRYLVKGVGTICLAWGVLALIGGLNGQRDVLNPVPFVSLGVGFAPGGAGDAGHDELFVRVADLAALDGELDKARANGRHLMLDFFADWCVDCVRMEKTTFAATEVRRIFEQDFHLVQVDLTDADDPRAKAIKRRYGVYGPPAILFFRNGVEIADLRLYGYRDRDAFLDVLDRVRAPRS